MSLGSMLKHNYGGNHASNKMDGQRYLNQQMQQSNMGKRNKAQSGLAQITTNRSGG